MISVTAANVQRSWSWIESHWLHLMLWKQWYDNNRFNERPNCFKAWFLTNRKSSCRFFCNIPRMWTKIQTFSATNICLTSICWRNTSQRGARQLHSNERKVISTTAAFDGEFGTNYSPEMLLFYRRTYLTTVTLSPHLIFKADFLQHQWNKLNFKRNSNQARKRQTHYIASRNFIEKSTLVVF